ncbi:MAG: hypothetical protein NT062_11825 [Proteobacteria bacterium]|nr:hypothetical protein [Pseudomonadota bacterium]
MGRRALMVSYFLQSHCEADLMSAADRCELAIADEVARELAAAQRDGARFKRWFAGGRIAGLAILVGSEVDQTYQDLTPPTTLRGKGERASIALAVHDPSFVLVANDRNAMWLALAELHHPRERMIGVPVFLRRLHVDAGLPTTTLDAVIDTYQGRRPTWWAPWRASLPA